MNHSPVVHENFRDNFYSILVAERDIDVLDWPPYLPDVNPIENLRKLLKAKMVELIQSSCRRLQDREFIRISVASAVLS